MKRKVLFIVCIAVCIQNVFSAEYKTISVEEAVKISLSNNSDYKVSELKLKEANERVNAVWGELFPVLESEASITRQDAETGFMSLSNGSLDLKFVKMKFGVNPGVFYNTLQASRSSYNASKEDVKKIKSNVELDVIKSYFAIILFEEMISLRKESIVLFKANLKDIQNMYATGSIAKFDLLQAQVQLNSQMPLLYEAENNYKTSLDYFNYVLGSDELYKADFKIIEQQIAAVSSENFDNKIEKLVAHAMTNRPEIVQLQRKLEVSEYRKNVYESYYIWPTFTIGGYYGYVKNDPNTVDLNFPGGVQPDLSQITGSNKWQSNWQVNIAATYRWGSLLQLDSNAAHAREEELAVKQATEEMMKLKKLISINISSCYSKLFTAYQTILSERENVKTADEGLRVAKESFRAGVIKNSDFVSSQYLFTAAKTNYINAINSYYTALAEIKRETGLADVLTIFE